MIKRRHATSEGGERTKVVIQAKSHYAKNPKGIPNRKAEKGSVSGDVVRWYMTPEEMEAYFKERFPDLERRRELAKNKIW